jgi:hypothetical protein
MNVEGCENMSKQICYHIYKWLFLDYFVVLWADMGGLRALRGVCNGRKLRNTIIPESMLKVAKTGINKSATSGCFVISVCVLGEHEGLEWSPGAPGRVQRPEITQQISRNECSRLQKHE